MLGEYFIGGKYQGQFHTESDSLPQKIVDDITHRVGQQYQRSLEANPKMAPIISEIQSKVTLTYRIFGTKLQPLKKVILCYSYSDVMNCAMLMHTLQIEKKKAVINVIEKRFVEIAIPC